MTKYIDPKIELYATMCDSTKSMQDYYMKETAAVVDLNDGMYGVEKSRINTSFCFGHGMYGISSTEDEQRANNMCKTAKEFEYFYNDNMEKLNEQIDILTQALENKNKKFSYDNHLCVVAIYDRYYSTKFIKGWKLLDCIYCDIITEENIIRTHNERSRDCNYRLATVEEIERILTALQEEKVRFDKRLHTYWKKYGPSKLHVWSYLVD